MLERRNAVWDVSAEKCWEIWMQKNICKNQKCQTFWHSIQKAKGQSLTSKQFAEPRASNSRGQSLKISISTKKAQTPDQSRSLHEPCAAVRHSNRAGGCSMLPTFQFWNKRAYMNNCKLKKHVCLFQGLGWRYACWHTNKKSTDTWSIMKSAWAMRGGAPF